MLEKAWQKHRQKHAASPQLQLRRAPLQGHGHCGAQLRPRYRRAALDSNFRGGAMPKGSAERGSWAPDAARWLKAIQAAAVVGQPAAPAPSAHLAEFMKPLVRHRDLATRAAGAGVEHHGRHLDRRQTLRAARLGLALVFLCLGSRAMGEVALGGRLSDSRCHCPKGCALVREQGGPGRAVAVRRRAGQCRPTGVSLPVRLCQPQTAHTQKLDTPPTARSKHL